MSVTFNNGASRLQGEQAFNDYTATSGMVGRESSGHPLANDENGSCYWADKNNMDPIWQHHDSNIAEHELGFDEKSMNGQKFNRIDCDELASHNPREATGYELGSNEHFTGNNINGDKDDYGHIIVDPDRKNGMTSGGQPECVTDPISLSDCAVSGPQKFDDPNSLANDQCNIANDILMAPDGQDKQLAINEWNSDTNSLKDRISGEQDYLQSRINDHENRMSQFPEGSLEYNRALDNRNWCQDYYNRLGDSKEQLQNKQDELNSSVNKASATQFDPQNYVPQHTSNSTGTGMGTGIQ